MITYHSTRGSNSTLSFKDVVLSGVADDKGLYLPNGTTLENLSNLTQEDLSYEDFVKTIFIALDKNSANYLDDLSIYSGFENSPEPVLREIENNKYVMELFHGPTKSFKDYALQPLGAIADCRLRQNGNMRHDQKAAMCDIPGAMSRLSLETSNATSGTEFSRQSITPWMGMWALHRS